MNIFSQHKKHSDYIIIIGCGGLGSALANTLSDNKRSVLVIDKKKEAFKKLSPSFGGLTIIDDATYIEVLKEIKLDQAQIVVVVTDDDNVNIMISQMAKQIFHAPQVITRLYDFDKECIYSDLGIETISPAILSIKEVDKILTHIEYHSEEHVK